MANQHHLDKPLVIDSSPFYHELQKTINQQPPPAIHQAAKKARQLEVAKLIQRYVKNIGIKFPVDLNDANVKDKGAILFATMYHIDPGLALLFLKKDTNLPPLLSPSSFPTKYTLFFNYFSIPHFDSKSAKDHAYLQMTKKFNRFNSLLLFTHTSKIAYLDQGPQYQTF